MILFGSRAYGRPGRDSDADFLLIANRLPTPADVERMAATLANDLETDLGFLPQIFPKTPDEVRAELLRGEPFLPKPISEGIVLYPPERPRSEFVRFIPPSR